MSGGEGCRPALGDARRTLSVTPSFGHATLKRRDARCGALIEALTGA
ncbi:hypothetical protein [Candidatus Poriferisodalis sp.]